MKEMERMKGKWKRSKGESNESERKGSMNDYMNGKGREGNEK